MASEAKVIGYEHTDDGLKPMDRERFVAFVQKGIDDLNAGRVAQHEEVMRMIREKLAHKSAA